MIRYIPVDLLSVDMAGLMDGALLPTIKCSNCGMSVEISEMGDHVCKRVPGSCSTENKSIIYLPY